MSTLVEGELAKGLFIERHVEMVYDAAETI